MRRSRHARALLRAVGLAAALAWSAVAQARADGLDDAFSVKTIDGEGGRQIIVIAPNPAKPTGLNPSGLAVDALGNVYIADRGRGLATDGSIIMKPADGRTPLRIMQGLTQPGDIELSPDQRTLIVAGPDGAIVRRAFGLSIRIANVTPEEGRTFVNVKTDLGTKPATGFSDGYFHVADVLVPQQTSETITVVVEHRGQTKSFDIYLRQRGLSPRGQILVDITF